MPNTLKDHIKDLYASQNFVSQLVVDESAPKYEFSQYSVELKRLEGDQSDSIQLDELLEPINSKPVSKALIIGPPGSGMTNILREIASNYIFNEKYDLVLTVNANMLIEGWSSAYPFQEVLINPLECFIHYWLKGSIELEVIILELKAIQNNKILFLIDDYHLLDREGLALPIVKSLEKMIYKGDIIATVNSDNHMYMLSYYSTLFDVQFKNEGYSREVMHKFVEDYFIMKTTMVTRDFNSDLEDVLCKTQQLLVHNSQLVALVKYPKFLALLCMASGNKKLMQDFVANKFEFNVFFDYFSLRDPASLTNMESSYYSETPRAVTDNNDIILDLTVKTIDHRVNYKITIDLWNRCKKELRTNNNPTEEYLEETLKFIQIIADELTKKDLIYTEGYINLLGARLISSKLIYIDLNNVLRVNSIMLKEVITSRFMDNFNRYYEDKKIDNMEVARASIAHAKDSVYSDDDESFIQPQGCCRVSYCAEFAFDNILLHYPMLIQEASKKGVANRLIELGAEDKEAAGCIIESIKEYNQNNPGSNGEQFVLDIIYSEEKTNPTPSMYDLSEKLFSSSVAFKSLETSIDALELFHIPTIENTKIFLRGVIHLQSMLQGNNAYLLGLSAIDVASLVAQGEIKEAAIEAVTSIGYMLLPMAITFSPAEYAISYSAVVVTYTGAKAAYNGYSFYQKYNSPEFQVDSDVAYKRLFDNCLGFIEKYFMMLNNSNIENDNSYDSINQESITAYKLYYFEADG